MCDGRQNNKCDVCSAQKTNFPLYKSTGECNNNYNPLAYVFKNCGQRKNSKHVNNQCYLGVLGGISTKLEYRCLNRNNIKESIVAGLKIFRRDAVRRVNFFDYFRNHNKTHIKCGNNSLSKNIDCKNILYDRNGSNSSVQCKIPGSETTNTTISEQEICSDLNFLVAKKFPSKTIEGAKRGIFHAGMSIGTHLNQVLT